MSLRLEAKVRLIDHQKLHILVVHMINRRRYITSYQQGQILVQNLNRIINVGSALARANPLLHHKLYSN